MRRHAALVSFLLIALTGCAATDQVTPDHAARARARTEVQERMDAYGAAVRSGDIASILDFWDANALVQENEAQAAGAELTQRAREFFPHNRIVDFSVQTLDLQAHDEGGVAYQWGQLEEAIQPNDAATSTQYRTNFLARWVRNPDGEWRIQRFLAVPAAQSTPAAVADSKAAEVAVGTLDEVIALDQLEESVEQFAGALRANEPDSALAFWTDDARYAEADLLLTGKPAIEQHLRAVFRLNRLAGFELTSRENFVHDHGSSAYQFGSLVRTLQPTNGKATQTERCNFVARWRRGADGHWRMDAFMATRAPR